MAEVLLAVARGGLERFLPLEVKNEACVGIVLAAGGYPGSYEHGKPITGLAEAVRLPGVEIFHAGTARDGDPRAAAAASWS
jgi:phosphoribosylamine--glycine ligase